MGGLWVLPPPPALASLLSARPWLVVTAGGFWDGERRHPAQRRGGRGDCDWQGRPLPAPLPARQPVRTQEATPDITRVKREPLLPTGSATVRKRLAKASCGWARTPEQGVLAAPPSLAPPDSSSSSQQRSGGPPLSYHPRGSPGDPCTQRPLLRVQTPCSPSPHTPPQAVFARNRK